jgi:hypothetical protein
MGKKIWIIIVVLLVGLLLWGFLRQGDEISAVETIQEEEEKPQRIFVPEDFGKAKARQIKTLYDKVELNQLKDLKSEELCEINFEKDSIYSNEAGKANFVFDKSLIGEKVKLSCDQFERFGISSDELLNAEILSESAIDETFACDYGQVTTPTNYFWFVSSSDLETDYCVSPLTVLPLNRDSGECFSEDELQKMRNNCEINDYPYYTIPDANGCDTIYCGWAESQSLCPTENLLDEAMGECEAEENNVGMRYTDSDDCAQIRCSECPDESSMEAEKSSCSENGGFPSDKFDEESGCSYIVCVSEENIETPE